MLYNIRGDLMNKICMMDPKYNKCPYVTSDKACVSERPCNMMVKLNEDSTKEKYVRQPRWYEQYYKNKSS